ncbi:hypothetical protein Pla22_43460 [Rubripirellula amarantea]|uniref:Uncharacterized protein n=1 Tax=Rubripirellula amarantea TaxID=2527999 RepID=A0A5C5WEJ0_9BACT|nr:hypothetical protein [Rubripirellula amarantea]TWT49154.1 hypothetical protein Pla22_43460 [Rubripirellula amarantea]
MSHASLNVLIQDGHTECYYDTVIVPITNRELLWGPDAFAAWARRGIAEEGAVGEDGDFDSAIVVDFDRKNVTWLDNPDSISIPRVQRLYERLLQTSWPGYEFRYASGGQNDIWSAVGENENGHVVAIYEDEEVDGRWSSIAEVITNYDSESEVEAIDAYDYDEERAWVSVFDDGGVVDHRWIDQISMDLICNDADAIDVLMSLPPADVPEECVVTEGMWVDSMRGEVGIWGGHSLRQQIEKTQSHWEDYKVIWAENGYEDHCAASGPMGVPMTDAQALARIMPSLLSTKRIDPAAVFDAIGGKLKRTAMQATGCLLMVLCAPIVLFGAVSGNWQAVGITIAMVVIATILLFKLIERKVAAKFSTDGLFNQPESDQPPAAGPLDDKQRRAAMEKILSAAGLPSLSEIDRYVRPEDDPMSLLT